MIFLIFPDRDVPAPRDSGGIPWVLGLFQEVLLLPRILAAGGSKKQANGTHPSTGVHLPTGSRIRCYHAGANQALAPMIEQKAAACAAIDAAHRKLWNSPGRSRLVRVAGFVGVFEAQAVGRSHNSI